MKLIKLLAGLAAFGFMFIAIGLGAGFWYLNKEFKSPGPLMQETFLIIERGEGLSQISEKLLYAGIIEDDLVFKLGVRVNDAASELKAGEYQFTPQMSAAAIMEMLREGKTFQRQFTIPEGRTSYEIVQILNNIEELAGGKIVQAPPEGSLLPETYNYQKGDTRAEKITRMQEAMTQTIQELCTKYTPPPNLPPRSNAEGVVRSDKEANKSSGLALPGGGKRGLASPEALPAVGGGEKQCWSEPLKSIDDVITLASIVEKETAVASERRRVAGVFINRLKRGMPLQTDPTVIYAITNGKHENEGQGPLGRRLLKKDLEFDSPYNTYKYPGLPPGPIANPGRASIEAVLNPESHDYIYFVADGTGGHAFGKTLAEHNRNVAEWRKIRAAQN